MLKIKEKVMQYRLRVFCFLAALGVTLFILKPILEVHEDKAVITAQIIRPVVISDVISTQEPVRVISLEVNSTVFDGVPVRIYRPITSRDKNSLLPTIVYFHGGGWISSSIDNHDSYIKKVAMKTALVVFSVGYRLAPKYPFPIPLDDCHQAVLYVLKHALELGVDASKVILMGSSAGGNLAAAVSQRMKDIDPPPLAQILIYPVMQSLDFQLPSYNGVKNGAEWMIRYFLPYYMGSVNNTLLDAMKHNAHVSDRVHQLYSKYVDYRKLPESFRKNYVLPPRVIPDPVAVQVLEPLITNPQINPLMAEDLTSLPQTMVLTVGLDALRDDGTLYAIRLNETGVPVYHAHYKSGTHGICVFGKDTGPKSVPFQMNEDIFKFIRNVLSNSNI